MRRGRPIVFLPAEEIAVIEQTAVVIASVAGAEDECDRIFRWRCTELRRAGYGIKDALLLALNTEIDLHLALELPARGCPHQTALRILA
jgi:hypothetical protein